MSRKAHNRASLGAGIRYGKLVVVDDSLPGERAHFKCDCGAECDKSRSAVRAGMTKSCGCLHSEHATALGLSRAKPEGFSEFVVQFGSYRARALRKGIAFNLGYDEFFEIAQQPCYYCGTAPFKGEHYAHNGIDRYDSIKGYSADNCVACCAYCNRAKSDVPASDFEAWMDKISGEKPYRPQGYVAVSGIVDSFGKQISYEKAVKYGWISSSGYNTRQMYDRSTGEEIASPNLFVDQGRQLMAYAFGFRPPLENYVCRRFGVGTGLSTPRVTDVVLEAPVALASGKTTGLIDSVDFLTAFVVRVAFTLGITDANGYAISELGLFSGNNTLIARKVRSTVINKNSEFAPTITWRIRF